MRRVWGILVGLVLSVGAGCGTSVPATFPKQLLAADGRAILLDDVKTIINDNNLTADEKRTKLRDLGIDDEKLIDALLTL